MVYLVYVHVEFTARGKQINLPPLTKVTQPGDDKLLLIQAFINPPGNLLHRSAEYLVSRAESLLTTLHFGTLAQKLANPSGEEIYHRSPHVSSSLNYAKGREAPS